MSLRRGFKAEANRIALSLRRDLGLAPHAPIDLFKLAERFNARVVSLSTFADACPQAVHHLMHVEEAAFSAGTIPLENGRPLIIYNDSHAAGRRNNSLAHEIAHLALGHEFTLPIDTTGCRLIDRDVEDEANWLGPTILIPNEAAIHILRLGMDASTACREYGVSSAVLQMRINASGARIRMNRAYH
jgi:hypothetical protein